MMSFDIRFLLALALCFAAARAATANPPPASPPAAAPPRLRVLFLPVDFPDRAWSRPWESLANRSRSGLVDRLVGYYDEVSARRFHIDAILTHRVYSLPRPRAEYVGKTYELVRDALAAASAKGPASERQAIAAARPQAAVVLFAGPGAESEIGTSSGRNPWSEAISGPRFEAAGIALDRALVVAVDPIPQDPAAPLSPFGVMAHEFGHLLGLPELYSPGHAHEGIGVWGLMGQGTWVGRGDAPPHPCAWSKLHLGWVDALVVDRDRHVVLPAVEKSAQVVKILAKGPDAPGEYFLIENRRRIGEDRRVPGEGLLVWHVDESRDSFRRSQDDAHHKRVDLLTADSWPSHLDIGTTRGGNRGDAGDPWADRREGPGPHTAPCTAAYDGTPGRFSIRNISPADEVMSFDVVFEGPGGEAARAPEATESARPR